MDPFADQAVLLEHSKLPAHILGLTDAVEGFRQIAETKCPFLVNKNPTQEHFVELLWPPDLRTEAFLWKPLCSRHVMDLQVSFLAIVWHR